MMTKEVSLFRVQNLVKVFSSFTLRANSFSIAEGEVVAFLGANGAGKTTLFELMTANTDASEGEIFLNEQRLVPEHFHLKRQMGYLPQNLPLPKWVTGEELLMYSALLHDMQDPRKQVEDLMSYWDCASYRSKPLATCSFGMLKRIGLALANLNNPSYLILDEPFSGLDLYHIHSLEAALTKRKEDGKATILSTHILPYVVKSCSRVFILDKGQVLELQNWVQQSDTEKTARIESYFFK